MERIRSFGDLRDDKVLYELQTHQLLSFVKRNTAQTCQRAVVDIVSCNRGVNMSSLLKVSLLLGPSLSS